MSGAAPTAVPASTPAAPVAAPAAAPAAAPVSASATMAAPAPSAAPSGATGTNSPAAPSNVTQIADWLNGLDEGKRGFATNKGWKNPSEVLDSYQNLEKLIGAPQDKIIKLPGEDDAEGWNSVYSRLGRPQTPADYKIEADTTKGGDPEFAKWASNAFHEMGLSTKQGQALAAKFNEFATATKSGQEQALMQKLQDGQKNLQKEWGAAYDQRIKEATRAAREFGFTKAEIDALENQIGFDGVMKRMQSLGSKIGESNFHTGDASNGALTPDQAKDKISALKQDATWVKKYTAGDAGARAELERLHKMAYQGEFSV